MRASGRSNRGCASTTSGRVAASARGCTRSATWITRRCRAWSSSTRCCSATPRPCGFRAAKARRATASAEIGREERRMAATMLGAFLPGGRRVELRHVPVPEPGPVQVLVEIRASTICGSDLRAIYREHTGAGAEAYRDVVAGHEPAGVVVAVGADCRRIAVGDRVALYHIAGCGVCDDCRTG